jgi:hypothetical protein
VASDGEASSYRRLAVDAAALGVLALCALVLHRDGLAGGPAFYELDTQLFYFPLAAWVSQQLHAGSFPLWLPGIFTGYPIFADGETGLAYPPQVALLAMLPAQLAMVWLRVLHVFLAGALTFAFLRTLRLRTLPALGGALVFAFGSFISAQMHHENVIRSAVWLPGTLLCLERAARQPRPFAVGRWLVWTALGALTFALAALGLHIQPVLMTAMALGMYAVFLVLVDIANHQHPDVRGALWPLASSALMVVGGLGVAAVQWLPLGEWALVSSRRSGVDYEFASAFALPPANLLSLIFPYFYRLSDATTWWTLWQQWEIELYVGIPTLALMIVGVLFGRRIEIVYFALLGLIAVWIGMAEYAPLFNLHLLLWDLPGFSFLRAPGRFSYLVVFACAGLAAFGLHALGHTRSRRPLALAGAVPAALTLGIVLVLFPRWHDWLVADPRRAVDWAQATYLATRAQYPIDPRLVVDGFLTSLDLTTVKTAWSLALLALTVLAFVGWFALGARRAALGQTMLVGLLAVDLLVFAFDFHPRLPLLSLTPALQAPSGERLLLHDSSDVPELQPDQLLAEGIPTTDGYSSLPAQRHVELASLTSGDPRLFDVWSAPLVLEPRDPPDATLVDGVRFRSQHPLVTGFGGSTPQVLQLPKLVGTGLRLIGTLNYAYNVPQGQTVATLRVGDAVLPIRAGIELSERAYDRPSLKGLVQHQRAPVALDFEETTPQGEDYIAHLYQADLAVPLEPGDTVTFTPTNPAVQVEIDGLGAIDGSGEVTSLSLADRDGLRPIVGQPDEQPPDGQLLQNTHALPRAYVLPRAQAFSPARHPELTPTQLVASPDVDLHRMALIENDPSVGAAPGGDQTVLPATRVEDLGPNEVRIEVTATGPSYLVLDDYYHRGWTAHVDRQPARIFVANALFRAVPIEAGPHVVDFRFEPLSQLVGGVVSVLCLLVVLGAIVWSLRRTR